MEVICIVAAGGVVALIVAVALFDWGGALGPWQRRGLLAVAGGMVWAGPSRFLGHPPGAGDLLFLAGLLLYLSATYGPALRRQADALDGTVDDKVDARALAGKVINLKPRG